MSQIAKEEKVRFKVIGFSKFEGTNDDNDCICITESGEEIMVDPFVGCAWEYENREHLINTWFEAEGFWYDSNVFLPRENKMMVIQEVTE